MAGEAGLEPTMSESKSDVFPVTPFPKGVETRKGIAASWFRLKGLIIG